MTDLHDKINNACKALRIAIQELNKVNEEIRAQTEALRDRKPKLEVVSRACKAHGIFPCRKCGTKHYEGCECRFCRELVENDDA